jgi:mono/diheme cytochrome c family protein
MRLRLLSHRSVFMSAATLAGLLAAAILAFPASDAGAQGGSRMARGPDFWQPGWMHHYMWGPQSTDPDMRARMQRHWTYMHTSIPSDYLGARSTVKNTVENIAAGGALYAEHCSKCHGKGGLGDGEAGKALSPSPALLAWMIQRPMAVDEYLLWTISEGGEAFGTAMPSFKGTLSREQIWKIVAYMRAGFPEAAEQKQ